MTLVHQKTKSRPSTSRQSRAPAKIHKEVLLTLGGDDDDEEELVVRQLQIKEAKGPNDPNNIINIAKKNKTLSRMEICELFAEVVKRVEMCDTFDLAFWLDRYLGISQIIDFAKISILLFDSAQIWGRKVDGLYQMTNNFHSVQIAVEEHQVEVIKKRKRKEKEETQKPTPDQVKKLKPSSTQIIPKNVKTSLDFQITTISDTILNKEAVKIPTNTNKLSEIIKRNSLHQETSLRDKLFAIKNIQKFNDRRKRKIPIFDEIFKIQRKQFFLTRYFENFGLDDLFEQDDSHVSDDLGDQDTIGSRRDYAVFMCNMNEEFCMFRCYNYQTEYNLHSNRVEVHNRLIEDYRKKWLNGLKPKLIKFPKNNFPMLLPAEYLKTIYNSQIYDNSDYLRALREENESWNKYKTVFGEENRLSYCILLCYRVATDEIVKRRIIREMTFGCYKPDSEEFGKEYNLRYKEEAAKLEMFRSMYRQIAEEKPFDPESYAVTSIELTSSSLQKENLEGQVCFRDIEIIESEEAVCCLQNENVTKQSTIETTPSAQLIENLSQPIIDLSKVRVSVDEGFFGSRSGSPILLSDLKSESHRWEPFVVMTNIDDTPSVELDDELKLMLDLPIDDVVVKNEHIIQPVPLNLNMFQIPEHLLRKTKIFKLPEEFDIWKNVRKRKGATVNEAGPTKVRIFENIPPSYMGRDDPEEEDFLGFEDVLNSTPIGATNLDTSQINDEWSNQLHSTILDTTQNKESTTEEISSSEDSATEGISSSQDSTAEGISSQDSGFHSQLTFNGSDLSSSAHLPESQEDVIDNECMLREAELEEAEENDRIQNVENWTEYVTPLLSQAKSRSNFDIQKYGQDILTQFPEVGSELSFHSIMENKRSDFTARNFLSMLMLANTENIEIKNLNKDFNRVSRSDEISITLLTTDMFYEANMDMENIPKRVKKSFTKVDAPLLNILPLGENPIEKSLKICSYMQKDFVDSERRKRSSQHSSNTAHQKKPRQST